MASIETALFKLLQDDAAVGALIADRIYPIWVPQGRAMPAVTYNQLAGGRDQMLSGPSGFVSAVFEFSCWAESYGQTRSVADAVRQALDGFDGTSDTIVIQSVQLQDENDIPAAEDGIDRLRRYGKILSFAVWFCETP
jgi:hypothetical protein